MNRSLWTSEQIVQRLEEPTPDRRPLLRTIQQQADIIEIVSALRLHPRAALTRAILCDMLGYRPDARSIPILVRTLRDRSARVRSAAADSLGKLALAGMTDPSVGPSVLAAYLKYRRPDGRPQIMLAAMGATKHVPALPVVVAALTSANPTTRQVAAWALMKLGSEEAIEPLEDVLSRESDPPVADMMKQALRTLRRLRHRQQKIPGSQTDAQNGVDPPQTS